MNTTETEHVTLFLESVRNRELSDCTVRGYDYGIKRLIRFLNERNVDRFQDVTREHLDAFGQRLREDGVGTGTHENIMRIVRMFFQWMESNCRIFTDPSVNVAVPRRPCVVFVVPTEEEVKTILDQPDTQCPCGIRDRAWLEVAYGCGLRRAELAAMLLEDVDWEKAHLRVHGKGGRERIVPLGKQGMYWIDLYLKEARPKLFKDRSDDKHLWLSYCGNSLGGPGMCRLFKTYVEKAGLASSINLHSLRKACATHMLANGAHPAEIQALLGHANLKHLGQYLSVTNQELKETHSQSNPGQ